MGASGWQCRVPYAGSLEESFVAAQEQVLASKDFIWDGVDDDEEPYPTVLQDVRDAWHTEDFWESGTHSLLDMVGLVAHDDPKTGPFVRPLAADDLVELFGTDRPSLQDFEQLGPRPWDALDDLVEDRWTGRSLVLHVDGAPAEVFFWGVSGD